MDLRVAAYAVVERRGKILLTHWRRGHLHGWTLPGGGLEAGEDPRDAVVREVYEETGLEARVGKLLGVDSRVMVREEVPEGSDPELHTIRIVYRATVKDGPLRNEIGGSSDEARWVPLGEVRGLRTLSLVQTSLRMAGISLRKPGAKPASKPALKPTLKSGAKPGSKQGAKPGAKPGAKQAAKPEGKQGQKPGAKQRVKDKLGAKDKSGVKDKSVVKDRSGTRDKIGPKQKQRPRSRRASRPAGE